MNCPFCQILPEQAHAYTDHTLTLRDRYPISPGHTLIIPRRHIASLFETTAEEREALWQAITTAQQELLTTHHPDGFNIGVNDGIAAGQTVMHLHIHLIPRYQGDCTEPRGGIRWIFPEKALYPSK